MIVGILFNFIVGAGAAVVVVEVIVIRSSSEPSLCSSTVIVEQKRIFLIYIILPQATDPVSSPDPNETNETNEPNVLNNPDDLSNRRTFLTPPVPSFASPTQHFADSLESPHPHTPPLSPLSPLDTSRNADAALSNSLNISNTPTTSLLMRQLAADIVSENDPDRF